MSNQYISNSDIYQVNAERDISVILSRFNTNYIYDCIESALLAKSNTQFIMTNPNLIRSLEDNFNILKQNYPDDIKNINNCREETYIEIINYLCSKFNLAFNDNDDIDLYSAAYYLYELLVSKYLPNLTKFFSKFILQEKSNIYKSFNLDKFKKTSNINYKTKYFKDNTIQIIILQIPYIIEQLMSFNFDFETIVNMVYDDNNIAKFITSIFYDNEYFYNFYKQDITNDFTRPNIITDIRLIIQNNSITDSNVINFVKEDNNND